MSIGRKQYKQRIIFIDIARAIAIFLVVLGHFIQYNLNNPDSLYIYKLIYSFHMPLFMFISGYVSYESLLRKPFITDIYNKTLVLLYPFFLWSLISHFIYTNMDFYNIIKDLICNPSHYAFWFLWILYWIYFLIKVFFIIHNNFMRRVLDKCYICHK